MTDPKHTIEIADHQALAERVAAARRDGVPLIDYGQAHTGLGYPPPDPHTALRLGCAGDGVIEHYERDLTVRLHAGARLGDVQRALARAGQFLPIDGDDALSIGEVIHHFVYGPLRMAYGSVRDLLLGLRFIDGRGGDNHVGGRTVKNVAGYDLSRFMVGSLGEMGLVYEATLRTYALPARVMTVELALDAIAPVGRSIGRWMTTQAAPGGAMLALTSDGWRLFVHYFGTALSNAAQLRALERAIAEEPGYHLVGAAEIDFSGYRSHWSALTAWRRDAPAVVKVVVPPARCGELSAAIEERFRQELALSIFALPAYGCLFIGGALGAEEAGALDRFITEQVRDAGGFRAWHRRPRGAERIEPFAPAQTDWPMLRKLKGALDPDWILNPGRMLRPKEVSA